MYRRRALRDLIARAGAIFYPSDDPRFTFLTNIDAYRNLFEIFQEVVHFLDLTDNIIAVTPSPDEVFANKSSGFRTLKNEEQAHSNQFSVCLHRLVVLLKALHEWTAHLGDLLVENQKLKATVHPATQKKLEWILLLRHKLVAHKGPLRGTVSGNGFSNSDIGTLSFSFIYTRLHDEMGAELEMLYGQAATLLRGKEGGETNTYERLKVLCRHYDELNGSAAGRVAALVEKYGGTSATFIDVASLFVSIGNELLIPLAQTLATASASDGPI